MKLGEKRRTYLANSLSKIAEFVISILIIGYFVATKLDPKVKLDSAYLLLAVVLSVIFIAAGMLVTPEKEGD